MKKSILITTVLLLMLLCLTGYAADYTGLTAAESSTQIALKDVNISSVKALINDLKPYSQLQDLTLDNCNLNMAQVLKLHSALPDVKIHADFIWNKTLFHTDDTEAVLPKAKYSFSELTEFISVMNRLETLDLTSTSSNLQRMQALTETFPNVKFLFSYSISGHGVTSKITAFSSLGGGDSPRRDEKYFECLQYCPDLLALDLGHQKIKSL